MDQALLRSYLATIYELPTPSGALRVSLDGEIVQDMSALPDLLARRFALLTAYNPRSMLLPRKVNEQRHHVLRDLLIIGGYRVEPAVGYEADADSVWREPAWLVHRMDRDEAVAFGRVFRQNTIVFAVVIVPVQSACALGLAVLVNAKVRGTNFFRTVYFLPVVTSMVVVSMLWLFMYQQDGLFNALLARHHGPRLAR